MTEYGDFDPAELKHLEMVQTVIGRLAGNGFLMKGWSVTVAGAFFGFAVNSERWELALASVLPTLIFWGLDAYFLRSERLFRELYRLIACRQQDFEPFFMAATSETSRKSAPRDISSYWRTALGRPVLAVFYGGLLLAAMLVATVVASIDPATRAVL